MTITATEKSVTTQVYRVFIKATAQAIWDAITSRSGPRNTATAAVSSTELQPGGAFRALASEPMKAYGAPDVIIVGEVVESTRRGNSCRPGIPSGTLKAQRSRTRASYMRSSSSRPACAG